MATKVLLKRSNKTSDGLQPSQLEFGELALNYTNKTLAFKNNSNTLSFFNADQPKVYIGSGDLPSGYDIQFDPTADVFSGETGTSDAVVKTGDRSVLAGYQQCSFSSTAITIDNDSPDVVVCNDAATVSNGTAGTFYKKVLIFTPASPSLTLGSSWHWQGGSAPTLTNTGYIELVWANTFGVAKFVG